MVPYPIVQVSLHGIILSIKAEALFSTTAEDSRVARRVERLIVDRVGFLATCFRVAASRDKIQVSGYGVGCLEYRVSFFV